MKNMFGKVIIVVSLGLVGFPALAGAGLLKSEPSNGSPFTTRKFIDPESGITYTLSYDQDGQLVSIDKDTAVSSGTAIPGHHQEGQVAPSSAFSITSD